MGLASRKSRLLLLRQQLEIAREDGHDHEVLRLESLIAEVERLIAEVERQISAERFDKSD